MTDQSSPTPLTVNITGNPNQGLATFSPMNSNGLQVLQSMAVETTRKDIENITVVKVQDAIRARVADLRKELLALRTSHSNLQTATTKFLEAWPKTQFESDTRTSTLESAIQLYTNRKLTPSYGTSTYNARSQRITGSVTVESDDFSYTIEYDGPAPATFTAQLDEAGTIARKVQDLESQIMAAKTALSNDTYIRTQAAASLASSHLKRTDGGEALLKAVEEASNTSVVEDLIHKLNI